MDKVSISDVAKKANVSVTTVSRVLNDSNLVKDLTKEKVLQVISDLNYRPNELARGLRSNETRTIGVIVGDILNPFYTAIARGIEDVSNKFCYNIILCNTDGNPDKEKQYIQALIDKRVDGLIVVSSGTDVDYKSLVQDKHIVFVDGKPQGFSYESFDAVLCKNEEGSRRAVEHLIKSGFRRVAIITYRTPDTGYERLIGYKHALEANGLKIDDSIIKIVASFGHNAFDDAKDIMTKTDCDAVFTANFSILTGVLRAASELGIDFSSDMGLASFDDVEWMQYYKPKITAVRQPTYSMGATAMEMLLKRITGDNSRPVEIRLDSELIIRESSIK